MPNNLEKQEDLVTKPVGGWAASNSLLSFKSPMFRPQAITQMLRGNMNSALQTASSTADPITEDADIICIVLRGIYLQS